MAEYLAPGVYIEERSFRSKSIEGVSTSTAGFIGPTRFGPLRGEPELVTSFADFERIYGGLDQLEYDGDRMHNYVAHAVRNFFEEGGRRLYVTRVYKPSGGSAESGYASAEINVTPDSEDVALRWRARYPGAAGDGTLTFQFHLGPNILGEEPKDPADPAGESVAVLRGARSHDLVWVKRTVEAETEDPEDEEDAEESEETEDTEDEALATEDEVSLYWLERYLDAGSGRHTFRLRNNAPGSDAGDALLVTELNPATDEVRILTVDVTFAPNHGGTEERWSGLTFHPDHPQSLTKQFAEEPSSRAMELYVPLVATTPLKHGVALAEALLAQNSMVDPDRPVDDFIADDDSGDAARAFRIELTGGSDGTRPGFAEYEGDDGDGTDGRKSGLKALEDVEDISMVAAPGSTFGYDGDYEDDANAITRLLISHAERMRYRIAVLDAPNGQLPSEIRRYRGKLDSTHAALYYPWIRILDPVTQEEINLPPSGFVTGIYARNDVEHGVHKAPANEVVRSALGLELFLNQAQQDVLNPIGVNCVRTFEGRGVRLWGARTIASDSEWKYVNVRRYFAYLERSIETSTQWIVFMNNMPSLWEKVRITIEEFLYNEWRSQRLMGTKPAEAYFVRCDRSTMTQNDLDNGRLVCLVGVAPVRPAEYVIFRIGQWTADHKA